MQSSAFVDWISFVIDGEVIEEHFQFKAMYKQLGFEFESIRRVKPRNSYAIAYSNADGVLMMSSPSRLEMGVNVVLTGQVLAKFDWFYVMNNLMVYGGHFARIDLTVDVRDGNLDITELYETANSGQADCRARNVTSVRSKTGDTCYIGSRTSERFMRIYDKAGEQGISGQDWKRVELELSGNAADNAASLIQMRGRRAIPGLLIDFANFPSVSSWNMAFCEVSPVSLPSAKKLSDTRKWILERVTKTIAREIFLDPKFENEFLDELQAHISELRYGPKAV